MCTRPLVVARSRASRDRVARVRRRARSLDDAARSYARAARRLADAPSDSRASDSRAWRVGVESKRRALLARDSRDARAIRDSRPTDGSSLARRRSRRGRGRASSCAASRASRRGRGRADRPRPTDRVFLLCTHTKRSPRVASSHCLPTRDGPLREATTPDTPSTRARRRQSTTTTTTTMLAQRAQAFATGGATVASRARARATRGRTGRRAQTRAGIPIHIEYCEK